MFLGEIARIISISCRSTLYNWIVAGPRGCTIPVQAKTDHTLCIFMIKSVHFVCTKCAFSSKVATDL